MGVEAGVGAGRRVCKQLMGAYLDDHSLYTRKSRAGLMSVALAAQIGLPIATSIIGGIFGGGGEEMEPLDFSEFMKGFQEGGEFAPKDFGLSEQELGIFREGQRSLEASESQGLTRSLGVLRNTRRGSSAQAASLGIQAASARQQSSLALTRRAAAMAEETRRRNQIASTQLGISAFSAVSQDRNEVARQEIARENQRIAMFGDVIGSVTDSIGSFQLLESLKSLGEANVSFDDFGDGQTVSGIQSV